MNPTDDDGTDREEPRDVDPAAYPALEGFFLGYLHQDLGVVHGDAVAAMEAFIAEAGPEDLLTLAREWQTLRTSLLTLGSQRRLRALGHLGAAWQPVSWQDAEALFERLIAAIGGLGES